MQIDRSNKGYWSFYWPLGLTSTALLLERQVQNGLLARYPDSTSELATFALAQSSFQLVNAALIFLPQMVTVLGRSRSARRRCRSFIALVGVILAFPLAFMAFTAVGQQVLNGLLNIPVELAPQVARYLQWLAPLVMVNAMRHYCTGVLVLGQRTETVTLMNVTHMVILVAVLLTGFRLEWGALPTLALGTVMANSLTLVAAALAAAKINPPDLADGKPASWRAMWRFFWPVALTSLMFALSRPVLYAYVNLTTQAVVTVAALRVAFDFAAFFQNPVNQFRHVYAMFGATDPNGVRRFMFRVTGVLVAIMALIVFTPLSGVVFGHLLGIEGEVLRRATQAMAVLCLIPVIIALRNLNHGKMLVRRKTTAMAVAAILRVLVIAVAARALYATGWLDQRTACLALILGFAVEAFIVHQAGRRHAAT